MATVLQLRRGTTVQHSSFTGAVGELTVDTTKDTVVVHDGSTVGGFPLAKASEIADAITLTDLSVTDSGGDGSLSYDNTTGVFTYTGPSATEVRAHFSASTGITITNGAIATSITQYTDALARGAISAGTGISYNSTTGAVSVDTASIATHTYVDTAISNLVNGASAAYDTLKEIQDAMATDAELSAAIAAITVGNATQTITAGSYLTGGGTFTANQTSNSSVTLNVDATSANTASKVVARDASGNFSAGTITATLSGNASTVTNGVYTTDTGTVTNTMLAGSIANAKLSNSSVTIGSTSVSLGATATTLAGLTSVTSTSFVGALTGNASTVTNGVYTTDTGTVTNAMLAGSIANAKLVNSSITIAGTSVSLGGSFTATNILDAIKTVDGTGSGLDADLLDGQSSAYFRINIYDSAGTLLN